mmetsp:Transcript_20573/g.43196  ORF Transcript_20573/g.43196 Transcript_20573/m.43196 type:complete len:267 (-) Transcript_20573:2869-3669(-)
MIASSFLMLIPLLLNEWGPVQAFTSTSKTASPLAAFPRLTNNINRVGVDIRATFPSEQHAESAREAGVSKRRNFLAKFASVSLFPLLAFGPSPVSARGFGVVENGPLVYGDDSIMSQKEHGTTAVPVQENLRYGVSRKLADKICSFNRVFAEMGGYFEGSTSFEKDVRNLVASTGEPVTFYDSVSGKPLFKAPVGRSVDEFIAESKIHGWPSFRDREVVWSNVRVLRSSGETVSLDGTHLGHNLPDQNGNRYCINLVSIAGNPESS